MQNARTVLAVLVVGALAFAACGGSSTDPDQPTSTTAAVAADAGDDGDAAAEPSEDIEEFVEEVTDSLVDLQESEGGGTATLTVGGETWTFGSVLCAFGEEMIGQEGAVFNLSAIQDGMQLYAATDSFGDLVSLNDIEDFENPSVALEAIGAAEEFVVLDGKNVSASTQFVDGTAESFDEIDGTFEATCP